MAEEEMNILNKLEQIKINVEGKLYNFEAAKILCLINKLKQENSEKDKQIEELVKYIDNNNYVDSEECQFQYNFKIDKCIEKGDCKDCIKQHFKNMIN